MAAEGWIKLHRPIQDHWLWEDKPFSKGQAWIDLLILANHADNKFLLGNELILVERGSFITSEYKLSERWGWPKSKVRRFLELLEKDGMIEKKSNQKRTTINIENYSVYQEARTTAEPLLNYYRTTAEPLLNPNKNEKNDKNVKNERINKESRAFAPPLLEEVIVYCKERKNQIDAGSFIDFYSSKNWMIGKNKMKDWKAAIRTWERRNKEGANGANQEPSNRNPRTDSGIVEDEGERLNRIAMQKLKEQGKQLEDIECDF